MVSLNKTRIRTKPRLLSPLNSVKDLSETVGGRMDQEVVHSELDHRNLFLKWKQSHDYSAPVAERVCILMVINGLIEQCRKGCVT